MRQDLHASGTLDSPSTQPYVPLLAFLFGKLIVFWVDQGAYKFICRVDPRCGKRFVRGDLLTRHEERHQNRKNKQIHSDDANSPPPRIAPSPTGSPTSDLANNFTRAINIPMSSPEDDDDARSGPMSSPDEMSLDTAYTTYHSPAPSRPPFIYGAQSYPPATSVSPNNYRQDTFGPVNPQPFQSNSVSGVDPL